MLDHPLIPFLFDFGFWITKCLDSGARNGGSHVKRGHQRIVIPRNVRGGSQREDRNVQRVRSASRNDVPCDRLRATGNILEGLDAETCRLILYFRLFEMLPEAIENMVGSKRNAWRYDYRATCRIRRNPFPRRNQSEHQL